MKKNQERRLHRKNAKIAKEGGTLMTLNRPIKPDTTVRPPRFFLTADPFGQFRFLPLIVNMFFHLSRDDAATVAKWVT